MYYFLYSQRGRAPHPTLASNVLLYLVLQEEDVAKKAYRLLTINNNTLQNMS